MKQKYRIDESILLAKLDQAYGIHTESLSFIPIGDSAYSYQVNGASGERFYLKLFDHANDSHRRGILRLNHYLPLTSRMYREGLFRHLTYPIKTLRDEFTVALSDCTVALFNYIEGETLAEAYPFSNTILESIGMSVARLQQITPDIGQSTLMTEAYDVSFVPDLDKCMAYLEGIETSDDPITQSLIEQVLPRKTEIGDMRSHIRRLREAALAQPKEMVLSHGDLWGGNLIYAENELYLLDWESAQLAPRELDMIGYIGEEFEAFYSAYVRQLSRSVTVDFDVIRFYCYRNQLRNLTNWLMNILYRNLVTEQRENDLEMILYHCMNRWEGIEPRIQIAEAVWKKMNG
ncbi:aminoglycoside phosphotransferase family protein [Paenibacillus spongiae]|uniref:Aminoglycoside phosphotransferase family protein n=1 Tax=Paenibacillus spongiae TaxID=2909671 RepID=A0ABY5S774_9BACL|nr:aminoglycoside phosphotransferase family protein [Paenibacillus spongiae]UVI29761.1 aminoglycoside phosphotransferase family protein [Paenibacillus spongiae]